MRAASAPFVADLPVAGDATPRGARLLGFVERIRQTGMALSRCINRIAQQRLHGQDIRRMAPPGFNATTAHALVAVSVAWLAALRERLVAVAAIRPPFVLATGMSKTQRMPQGSNAAFYLPDEVPNPTEHDWHNWWELAKPLRIGPGGVAVAHQQIAGMSNRAVVAKVHDNLSTVLAQLGSAADIERLAALAAEADVLLSIMEATGDEAAEDVAADQAGAAPVVQVAGLLSHEPETAAEDDPVSPTVPDG